MTVLGISDMVVATVDPADWTDQIEDMLREAGHLGDWQITDHSEPAKFDDDGWLVKDVTVEVLS